MKVYTHDEAMTASLEYFSGDEMAAETYLSKYAVRDKYENILEPTPSFLHRRLAREFARIEAKYSNPMSEDEIYNLLSDNDSGFGSVIAQGSPMSGIGNPDKFQSLSNCFVVASPFDSYGGIMKTDQEEAQIMKRRGGVGFDISTIRPRGMATTNAARTTGGLALFMERYSNTCREVGQDGRRGALILTISCFEGSSEVLCEDGLKKISEIVDNKYSGKVWTHEGFKEIEAYQRFENQDIFEIECENGRKIKVTADHEFVVRNTLTSEEYLKAIKDVDTNIEELVFYDVTL